MCKYDDPTWNKIPVNGENDDGCLHVPMTKTQLGFKCKNKIVRIVMSLFWYTPTTPIDGTTGNSWLNSPRRKWTTTYGHMDPHWYLPFPLPFSFFPLPDPRTLVIAKEALTILIGSTYIITESSFDPSESCYRRKLDMWQVFCPLGNSLIPKPNLTFNSTTWE